MEFKGVSITITITIILFINVTLHYIKTYKH